MADPVLQDLNRHLADEADRECFGYAVEAVLDRWMADHKRVADTLDDMMGTSDHTTEGYTVFAASLAGFVRSGLDGSAVAYRDQLRGQLREYLRSDAEDEVRRNDERLARDADDVDGDE